MKKRLFICIAILVCMLFSVNAQVFKYYNDWDGHSGNAAADYVGTTKTINPAQFANVWEANLRKEGKKITGYCQKLSKTESFLIWSALEEYDYKDGEVYLIVILPNGSNAWLGMVVVITNGGNSFDWYGGFYGK